MKVDNLDGLTALRGFAAWWVVLYHFREALALQTDGIIFLILDHGYLAVDVFFVLSGFVIHYAYRDRLLSGDWRVRCRFVLSRIARVYPLHLVTLAFCLLNVWLILNFSTQRTLSERYSLEYFVASLLLIQNWGLFDYLGWNIPAWSISSELLAYGVYGLLYCSFCVWIGAFRFGRFLALLLSISLLILLDFIYAKAGHSSIGDGIPGLGTPRCLVLFLIGALICEVQVGMSPLDSKLSAGVLGFASILMIAYILTFRNTTPLLVGCWSALTILSLTARKSHHRPANFLFKILLHLGKISFSTYLIHFIVRDWIKFAVSVVDTGAFLVYVLVVLILSQVAYTLVEMPSQKFSRKLMVGSR